jgi:hypothetical protein
MISKLKWLKLEHLILGTLLVYVTLHVFEEWLFGFPDWALRRWGIPGYDVPKWLLHNVYFAFFLAVGYLVYRSNQDRWMPLGLGILVWGFLNSAIAHIAFTVIFLEYSPGIITSLIFVYFAVMGLAQLRRAGRLSWKLIVPSVACGLLYWGVPMVVFIEVDKALGM